MDSRTKQESGKQYLKASSATLTDEDIMKLFAREYDEEFKAFEDNIRTVARGNTGLSNTWTDYLGIAGISAGTVFTNATFALLAALKIVSGFVTLGTGLAVSAAGIAAGVFFRKYRITYKRTKYKGAEEFLENELYEENRDEFRELLQRNLMPAMRKLERSQINYLVKSTIAAIANLILDKKIVSRDDLRDDNFISLLEEGIALTGGFALNKELMQRVIIDLKLANNNEFEAEPAMKPEPEPSPGSVTGLFGLFAPAPIPAQVKREEFTDEDLYQKDSRQTNGF